jgi:Protein of unknown function (DUF3987)
VSSPTTPRKLENWIESFIKWVAPRSEAPESFIMFTAFFTLAAAVRRNVFIGERYLGGWRCYPHLYIIFVGPPGMRKTVTISKSTSLLEQLSGLSAAPTNTSQAALSLALAEAKGSAVYIVGEEFGDLFLKSGTEMYEFLTSAFDAKTKLEVRTIGRGVEFVENPCINMLAGTTPQWLSGNMPASVIGGGFAARVLFVYADKLRSKQLFYSSTEDDTKQSEALRQDLAFDLAHIATNLNGEFTLDDEAKDFLEDWYNKHEPARVHPKVRGYYARKHVHILKMAMLFRLAYSDDLTITKADAEGAIGILSTIEPTLLTVFEGVGKNVYSFDMKDIYDYLKQNGKIERSELLNEFRSVATPNTLMELIQGLLAMRRIKAEIKDQKVYYEINEGVS